MTTPDRIAAALEAHGVTEPAKQEEILRIVSTLLLTSVFNGLQDTDAAMVYRLMAELMDGAQAAMHVEDSRKLAAMQVKGMPN